MKFKKYVLVFLLIVIVTPSLAFASWWNPGSWGLFNFLHKKEVPVQEQTQIAGKGYEDKINELQKQIEELKNLKTATSTAAVAATTNTGPSVSEQIKTQVEKEVKLRLAQKAATTENVKIVENVKNTEVANGPRLSEQVGVTKEKLAACVSATDKTALQTKITASVESGMKGIPPEQRGTPYAIIIGSNGVKSELRGSYPIEEVKKVIEEVKSGKVTVPYGGEVVVVEAGDHIMGSSSATVKVIEYSDLECPYCKSFHATMKQVVAESNGSVSWVYRHWPIHAGSMDKLVAAECVATLKGNDAFWKYVEMIFDIMNTGDFTNRL